MRGSEDKESVEGGYGAESFLASEAHVRAGELVSESIDARNELLFDGARVVIASLPHTCTLEDLRVQVAARSCQLARRSSATGAIRQPLRLALHARWSGRPIAAICSSSQLSQARE